MSWRATRTNTQRVSMIPASYPSPASQHRNRHTLEEAPLRDSSPIRDLALKHLFIQLLVEMQPLENELYGRRQHGRTFDTFEPLHSGLQSSHATGVLTVDGRRHRI